MTVKEVRNRIDELKKIKENMLRIQNYCLHSDKKKLAAEIEDVCSLYIGLRNLTSDTARFISEEISRLEKLIDNAVIKDSDIL